MFVSDARKNANRINAQKSTGPKTAEGKARSRANSFKHGLAGNGVVMAQDDLNEIDKRAQALRDEFNPQSPSGQLLVRRMAVCSMQMDRGTEHETAAIALNVRHAVEAFDDERFDTAESLMDTLGESPRSNLRRLRRMPEGVDRMIEEWTNLKGDLTRDRKPHWTAWHLERSLNLTGLTIDAPFGSPFKSLSQAVWGDFRKIEDLEVDDRQGDALKAKARGELVERIDREIAALEAHRATLDHDLIELDRSEAGSRALFDPSKEAILARRYEAAAQRHFFRALKELRRVEAEYAARPEPEVAAEMGSSGEIPVSAPRLPSRPPGPVNFDTLEALLSLEMALKDAPRGPDGRIVRVGRPDAGQ